MLRKLIYALIIIYNVYFVHHHLDFVLYGHYFIKRLLRNQF